MKNVCVLNILIFCLMSSCNSNDDIVTSDDYTVIAPLKSYKGNWRGAYSYSNTNEYLIGDIFLKIDQDHKVTVTFTQYNFGTIGTWGNGKVSDDGMLELDYNWGIMSGKIINDSISGIMTPHLTSDRPIYWNAKKL